MGLVLYEGNFLADSAIEEKKLAIHWIFWSEYESSSSLNSKGFVERNKVVGFYHRDFLGFGF